MSHWTFDEPRRSEFETEEDYREAHDLYECIELRLMEAEYN